MSLAALLVVIVTGLVTYLTRWTAWTPELIDPGRAAVDREGANAQGLPAPGPDPANAVVVSNAQEVVRRTTPGTGLAGVVLDDLGAPIPHVLVYLRQVHSRMGGADMSCTDAAGRFAFAKAHDVVCVSVENELAPPQEVTITSGQPGFVELRAVAPCLVLEGFVRASSGPAPRRIVFVRDVAGSDQSTLSEATDDAGYYRHVLPAGSYALSVSAVPVGAGGGATPLGRAQPFPMGTITLTPSIRTLRKDLFLPTAEIRALVRDAAGRPVANAHVRASAASIERWCSAVTDDAGVAVLTELMPANWVVAMASLDFAAVPDREIEILGSGSYGVEFAVARAGDLRVVLDDGGGQVTAESQSDVFGEWLRADPAWVLRPKFGSFPAPVAGIHTATVVAFTRLLPGPYELSSADRTGAAGTEFGAVEPFVHPHLDVRAGVTTTITVKVVRRPLLRVLVRDAAGTVWPLPFTLHGATGLVVVRGDFDAGYGEAFVPPGEYRVVVAAPGGPIEERVTVGDRHVTHVVVVPGTAPPGLPFPRKAK